MNEEFLAKYGNMFGNNADIGKLILDQFQRHGVDIASVTIDAVQKICDQLRMEATTLLDAINANQNQAAQLIDKIDKVDSSVQSAAIASGVPIDAPQLQPPPAIPQPTPAPELMQSAEGSAPAPAQPVPPAAGGEPVPQAPADLPADVDLSIQAGPMTSGEPAGGAMPPAAPPPEESLYLDNISTLSDFRAKHVKADKSNASHIRKRARRADHSFTPTRSMIDVVRGW